MDGFLTKCCRVSKPPSPSGTHQIYELCRCRSHMKQGDTCFLSILCRYLASVNIFWHLLCLDIHDCKQICVYLWICTNSVFVQQNIGEKSVGKNLDNFFHDVVQLVAWLIVEGPLITPKELQVATRLKNLQSAATNLLTGAVSLWKLEFFYGRWGCGMIGVWQQWGVCVDWSIRVGNQMTGNTGSTLKHSDLLQLEEMSANG